MSFFNPQGIPEFVLHNYKGDLEDNVDRDEDRDEFEDDLDVLRGYSLVSVTATWDVCEIHSLVQFCTRAWLSVVDDAERWRQRALPNPGSLIPRRGPPPREAHASTQTTHIPQAHQAEVPNSSREQLQDPSPAD
ncbi:hypothetical protein AUP68_00564 [Ilyonectria robusta]